ncbi:MAG TPA: glycoside hydrolase family 38 C-terminal domain-containing protein [Acidobacteriaceae bacterium]|jgi:alpha-mannosidase|nr:glycoside hydrolase family 38 C-terminal domain-containing protein [Acidobacteriaceae bacterium]
MPDLRRLLTAIALLGLCSGTGLMAQHLGEPPILWHEKYPAQMDRLQSMTFLAVDSWRFHDTDIPHGEDPDLDDTNWQQLTVTYGDHPGNAPSTGSTQGWYRAAIRLPATVGGKSIAGARLRLAVHFSSDGRVFLNGGLVEQGDSRTLDPVLITDKAAGGETIHIAIRVPFHQEQSQFLGAQILVDYPNQPDPGFLRSEIQTTEAILSGFPDGRAEREQQLDGAVRAIDFSALDNGNQAAFTQSLATAQQDLQPLNAWMRQFTVRLVGNAHIDMAWLWPWTETVEVVRDTFRTALQLMDEYPGFIYTQSSVRDFEWLQDKYPKEFQEIQKRVREGRWELVGGMWVEPDLNMPDGESMVRQILVGKRYFERQFGVDVNVGWNPDSFGFSWQLPQIYRKSGFDSFVTQKMSWNDTTVFPYKLFWWQSPDGSKVLTYFPHNYNGTTNPVGLANDIANYVPATHFPEIMQLYGVGDHGGGPTREELDEAVRLEQPATVFPKAEFSTARGFFDDVEHSIATDGLKLPAWDSELYLEDHRGCYTTQSETKKEIRHNEEQLENAEKFSAFSFAMLKTPYSNPQFEGIWEKVLFDDFHDVMPGSGVGNNYVEAARNLHEASLESGQLLSGSLNNLTADIDTQGAGTPFVIFNPLSWKRTAPVTVEVHTPPPNQQLEAVSPAGHALLAQVISTDAAMQRTRLQVMVPDVPSLGYTVIHVRAVEHAAPVPSPLRVSGTTIENEYFQLRIDPKTGCVTSLVEKADHREILAPGGCGDLLQTFVDMPPRQDAWEVTFDGKSWDLKDPESVKVVESGPERVVVEIRNRFQNSDFVRDIVVHPNIPRVDVHMKVNWHEQHILLKVGFPVNAQATQATFEIPYGTIERPTTRNTPAERAQYEVPAQRWGDISDAAEGFSLLNASKYGYDAKGNVIRLSLLRSPRMPAPDGRFADQGYHEFTYALYPHSGDWKAGGTMRQGYDLNYPLIPVEVQPHAGAWLATHSFASVSPDNVIVTAVKKAEDSNSLIFRYYEFAGKSTDVTLHLPEAATSAAETDLMEKNPHPLRLEDAGRALTIPTGPFSINTVEATFGPSANE